MATTAFICCGHFNISSQVSGFSKTYFLNSRTTIFHAVRQIDNDVLVLGQMGHDTAAYNGVFLARLDTFGNLIKLKVFQDPEGLNNLNLAYYSCEAICSTPDKGFVFAGATRINKNIFMIKVDSTLELEYYKEYSSNVIVRYLNYLIFLEDSYYAIGIFQTPNLDYDIFIQKMNLNGNFIWEKKYGIPKNSENAQSAVIENNGITLLASEGYDPSHAMYNDEQIWNKLFHIDTSGVVTWSWKSQLNEEGGTPEGLLKIQNHYFYTAHPGYQPSSQTIHYSPEIVCRDSSFNLKWRRTYGDTLYLNWFSTLTTGPDSFVYAAGYIPDGVTWGRVCKIDPENGDLIWDARDTAFYIPGWGSRNRMEGLTVLPSGSVIAVGYTVDYSTHENGLLYKVTKDGCIDTLCTTVGIENVIDELDKKIKVYPNPARDNITIDAGSEVDLTLDIFNLQGSRILMQKLKPDKNQIDTYNNHMTSGLYLWRAMNSKGEIVRSGKIIIHQN